MNRLITLIVALVLPISATAGGGNFSIKVTKFEQNDIMFSFTAQLKNKFTYDKSGCESITVVGKFDAKRWRKHSKIINKDKHLEAIQKIRKAFLRRSTITFGYIGAGLNKTLGCTYSSKGLFHDEQGVYSVYYPI